MTWRQAPGSMGPWAAAAYRSLKGREGNQPAVAAMQNRVGRSRCIARSAASLPTSAYNFAPLQQAMIGLDRPKLMALAQLLGGDYCEGVAGAGNGGQFPHAG